MKALIDFSSYSTESQKQAACRFILTLAEEYSWQIKGPFPMPDYTGSLIKTVDWTAEKSFLLADTVAKTVEAAVGSETVDGTYNALTQLNTIISAIKNNPRVRQRIAGYNWAFEADGDVYVNNMRIPSATFEQIIAARTTAMGG
jgi:hypothetical protein